MPDDIYLWRKIHRANEKADNVKSKVEELERLLRGQEGLSLACQAMWELIREQTGLSEEDLAAKINEVDGRDGSIDGKLGIQTLECPSCGKLTNSKRTWCLFCGEAFMKPHPFEI